MRTPKLLFRLALTLLFSHSILLAQTGNVIKGKVTGVSDGDSVVMETSTGSQKMVHLSHIDAPELHQNFGDICRQSLETLLIGKQVSVQVEKPDPNGQFVGRLLLKEKDVSLDVLSRGCAWYISDEQDKAKAIRTDYALAQEKARKERVGIWTDLNARPPWEFRQDEELNRRAALERQRASAQVYSPSGDHHAIAVIPVPESSEIREGGIADDDTREVYVHGYFRNDGTYVEPYWRRAPKKW